MGSDGLCAALVAYEKYDSYGEFVFDFAWADFYNRNGLNYYPKLVVCIPFTPATGERILGSVIPSKGGISTDALYSIEKPVEILNSHTGTRQVQDDTPAYKKELLQALLLFTHQKNYSGIHFLFQTEEETQLLEECGFQRWLGYQFHWKNKNYKVFEDYLNALNHKRRRQIIKERELISTLSK